MANTLTEYATSCVWGDGNLNNTGDLKVGKSGSGTYRGVIRFPTLAIPNAVIQTLDLKMKRIDDYSTKVLEIGVSNEGDYGATVLWSKDFSIPSGNTTRTFSILEAKDIVQAFTGNWYITVRHGSGDNSYCEFNGDEDGSNAPRIVVTYENATVEYYTEGGWQKCLVNYRTSTGWVQCIPYYYKDGAWVQV